MAALKASYPLYLANEAKSPNQDLAVTDKFTGEVATRVAQADAATIDAGIAACVELPALAAMAAYRPRQAALRHALHRAFDELAMALCIEAGKPIRDSRGEVTWLIDTFRIAAERASASGRGARRISPRAKGYRMWKRV